MDIGNRRTVDTERIVKDVGHSDRHDRQDVGSADASKLVSREEAKRLGLKRYFTGEPCKHGHVAERFVSSTHCSTCSNWSYENWYATAEGKAAISEYRARPDRRARNRASSSRWNKTPEGRASSRESEKRRNTPERRSKQAIDAADKRAKERAQNAANVLTQTLGIPHAVVRMEDGTFQPIPVSE